MIPKFARMVRGEALAVKEKQFIAARAPRRRQLLDRLAPHPAELLLVGDRARTLILGETILIAASLSFIGLAPAADAGVGAMISVGRKFLMDQWWYATSPACSSW